MKQDTKLSPKQVARAIGVSESSLKRWCDQGLMPFHRTVGGHRRLPLSGVLSFLRDHKYSLVRPELLGLPPTTSGASINLTRAHETVRDALETGDGAAVRRTVFDLYLSGATTADICDAVLSKAFHDLGERWQHGSVEIYQERRGVEITLRVLWDLRVALPPPEHHAPFAFGGTFRTDRYSIPTTMVELVLREVGWKAESYGSGHPASTLKAALRDSGAPLLWLSVSHVENEDDFVRKFNDLYEVAAHQGTAVIVGGRALSEDLRGRLKYTAFCESLSDIVAPAQELKRRASPE